MVRPQSFRKWALAFYAAAELPHFQKASFRAGGKIFATLEEEKASGSLKLSPSDQSVFITADPEAFRRANGAWGRQGWTLVDLRRASAGLVKDALALAYREVTERN